MDAIGERIKEARQERGLSQEELAQIINSTKSAISRYESGKRQPRIEQLKSIASALDVDVNWLMNGYTLEQRDQVWKEKVSRRFEEAKKKKKGKDRLNVAFDSLNTSGQQEAVKRVEELTEVPRYRRQEPAQPPAQKTIDSTDGTDTPAAQDAPEGAEEGE